MADVNIYCRLLKVYWYWILVRWGRDLAHILLFDSGLILAHLGKPKYKLESLDPAHRLSRKITFLSHFLSWLTDFWSHPEITSSSLTWTIRLPGEPGAYFHSGKLELEVRGLVRVFRITFQTWTKSSLSERRWYLVIGCRNEWRVPAGCWSSSVTLFLKTPVSSWKFCRSSNLSLS